MIAYIRAWQITLNETATQNDLCGFRFNTYIISALVIFYLQLNQKFPKLEDIPPSRAKSVDHVPQVDKDNFKRLVVGFFEFYGKIYEMKNQLISVNIGRWQDPQLEIKKTNFTPEQKRLKQFFNIVFFFNFYAFVYLRIYYKILSIFLLWV